jgi:hypothetical protein
MAVGHTSAAATDVDDWSRRGDRTWRVRRYRPGLAPPQRGGASPFSVDLHPARRQGTREADHGVSGGVKGVNPMQ